MDAIGNTARENIFDDFDGGVAFSIPYDGSDLYIALETNELDAMAGIAMQKIIGHRALCGFDFIIKPENELPFFVGANQVEINGESGGFHDIKMGILFVSQSVVNEHRGVLSVSRSFSSWENNGYEILPELKEPQPGDPFYLHPALQGV